MTQHDKPCFRQLLTLGTRKIQLSQQPRPLFGDSALTQTLNRGSPSSGIRERRAVDSTGSPAHFANPSWSQLNCSAGSAIAHTTRTILRLLPRKQAQNSRIYKYLFGLLKKSFWPEANSSEQEIDTLVGIRSVRFPSLSEVAHDAKPRASGQAGAESPTAFRHIPEEISFYIYRKETTKQR